MAIKPLKLSFAAVLLLGTANTAVQGVLAEVELKGSFAEELVAAVGASLGDLAAAGAPESDRGKTITEEETRLVLQELWNRLDSVAQRIPGDAVTLDVPSWTGQVLGATGFFLRGPGVLGVVGEVLTVVGASLLDGDLTAGEVVRAIAVVKEKIEGVLA